MDPRLETHPLISIRADATVKEAARLMADCSIAALGVLGPAKEFAGIVTERDLAWFVAQARDAETTTVAEIVNDFPVIVDGPVDDRTVAERMRAARVRHLVVREGDDLRILSIRDLLDRLTARPALKTARDAMSCPPIACRADAFFEEVAEILADRDISGMPVVDDGAVIGVISERDLAHALGGPMVRLALRRHNHPTPPQPVAELPRTSRRAKDIMTSPALSVAPGTPLEAVAAFMRANKINRVPVVDGDRLVGVVTRGDVLQCMAGLGRDVVIDLRAEPVLVGNRGRRERAAGLAPDPVVVRLDSVDA